MDSTNYFDYGQMYGDSTAFDGSAQGGGNSNMPFYTTADPSSGAGGQTVANTGSSFWSGFGSFASGLGQAATAALPQVVSNLTTPSTPNPNAAGQTNQTTAQKLAAQSGSMMPWILGGIAALLGVVLVFLQLRKRK